MPLPQNVTPTPIFDDYWRFISNRQEVFWRRTAGLPQPWTSDPILQEYRFTNVYRATDNISQFLLRRVIYDGKEATRSAEETFFRVLLFKLFNKNETWDILTQFLGEEPSVTNWNLTLYDQCLTTAQDVGNTIWGAAYMMTAHGSFGDRRHRMYLRLLDQWMNEDLPGKVVKGSMEQCADLIKTYRTMKDFLANQYTLDIGYTPLVDWDENDYIAAGPGTIRGLTKAFNGIKKTQYNEILRYIVETQDEHFTRLGLTFENLGGRKLHLNDASNCFCEVDKWCRAAHPDITVDTKGGAPVRSRIKRKFAYPKWQAPLVFPPKWGVDQTLFPGWKKP